MGIVPSSPVCWPVSGYPASVVAGRGPVPDRVLADKAYSSGGNRDYLRRRGIAATIPVKVDQVANRRKKGSKGGPRIPAWLRASCSAGATRAFACANSGADSRSTTARRSSTSARGRSPNSEVRCFSWLIFSVAP
jgi:hypothetical protein